MFIIFDLDDTLIDTSGTILPIKAKRALSKMVYAGLKIPDIDQAQAKFLQVLVKAKSSQEGLTHFLTNIHRGMEFYEIGYHEIYQGDLEGIEIKAVPHALNTLNELSCNHLLCIATAGIKQAQMYKLARSGIDQKLFYRIEVLHQLNKKKFYQEIQSELGIPSKNIYVCGDRITTDLIPAKELGFKTIHMKWGRGENFTEEIENVDYTIYQLNELKQIL